MARIWERVRGKFQRFALTLPIMLAILGPGIITGNVDNDAGGITTYSVIGARFGYSMLWMLLLITFTLAMIQEMSARMGVVTGKGLADLIRERFGIRLTMVVMVLLVFTNLTNTMGEFAGVAGASSILGLNRFIAIPVVAFFVWFLVVKGSYRAVEKVLLLFCVLFLTYVISAFMAHPNWGAVARSTVVPSFQMNPEFISLFIATIGTTIAPWMQFYQQSSVAEKGIKPRMYKMAALDTIVGCVITNVVAVFIIVACAATLHMKGITVTSAAEAAKALIPFAGQYAGLLFAIGLANASLFAASILPLSTSYTICEGFGWESGVSRSPKEAPQFHAIYTGMIVLAAAIIMIPNIPLIPVIFISQVMNGMLMPVTAYFALRLVNDRKLIGDAVNSKKYNVLAWACVGLGGTGSVIMVVSMIFPHLLGG